ncbi:MAG: type II toxin-antitoxin system VapC family toxin [Propionibacteriaceae bacterium]|nr:type II toxin-antitoxin system VapC family toxin [Propionibacteriaceae bacterium]
MIIADTNVVSEFMRDEPDPAVLSWAGSLGPSDLTICVVTVEEIERGIRRLPTGKRRRQLEQRWQRLVAAFREAILVYDVDAAEATTEVLASTEAAGRPMGLADAQVAGICMAGGHQLATRNVRDFEAVAELSVLNPFC